MTYVQTHTDSQTADLAEYTFTGVAIGTPAANRLVKVFFASRRSGTGALGLTVTIGGIAAAVYTRSNQTAGTTVLSAAIALVPTGTTATVVATYDQTMLRCMISVSEMTGLTNPVPSWIDFSIAADPTRTLNVPAGGLVVAAGTTVNLTTVTWTGVVEDSDFQAAETMMLSCGHQEYATEQVGLAVTCDFGSSSGGNPIGLFLVFAGDVQAVYPTGPGTTTDFTAVGAATPHECVDDLVDASDDDSTYVERIGSNGGHLFTFASPSIPAGSVVHSVAVLTRFKHLVGGYTRSNTIRVGTTNFNSSNGSSSTSYVDSRTQWVANPGTSAAWTVDQINGVAASNNLVEFGWTVTVLGAGEEARYTQCYLLVNFTPPAVGGGGNSVPVLQAASRRRSN